MSEIRDRESIPSTGVNPEATMEMMEMMETMGFPCLLSRYPDGR